MFVAPLISPAFVMPPLLASRLSTVVAPASNVPVVVTLPFSSTVNSPFAPLIEPSSPTVNLPPAPLIEPSSFKAAEPLVF